MRVLSEHIDPNNVLCNVKALGQRAYDAAKITEIDIDSLMRPLPSSAVDNVAMTPDEAALMKAIMATHASRSEKEALLKAANAVSSSIPASTFIAK